MTSTQNDCARRSQILLDATIQFCTQRNPIDAGASDQYSKMFYSLVGDTNSATRKLISSRLARCHNTPRAIAYFLAMEPVEIASPFLLISPVLWERDILQLVAKVETASLSVIARRSDMNARVAQAIVAREDKTSCRILSKNPVLKLNTLLPDNPVATATSATLQTNKDATLRNNAHDQLMELARSSGKLGNMNSTPDARESSVNSFPFATRLLEYAKSNNREMVSAEIAMQIDMPVEKVVKLVMHESSASLAIFLKGLNLNRSQASQLLLLINKRTGRNIAEFTGSMEQYDRFSIAQCHDIMRNLGAGKIPDETARNLNRAEDSVLESAAKLRRRQIVTTSQHPLFGEARKAG